MIHLPVMVGTAIAGWLVNENQKQKKRLDATEKQLLQLQLAEAQRKLEKLSSGQLGAEPNGDSRTENL
jgi:hypothetical protein